MESNVPLFFEHNIRFLCYSASLCIQFIGFSPKVRPKMRLFFEFFFKKLDKNLIFFSVFITLIIIPDLTISISSSVLKKSVFRRV